MERIEKIFWYVWNPLKVEKMIHFVKPKECRVCVLNTKD
jgi:hypothetical protein